MELSVRNYVPSFPKLILKPSHSKKKNLQRSSLPALITAQKFKHHDDEHQGEGSSSVDEAAMRIMGERMEEVRKKEREEECVSKIYVPKALYAHYTVSLEIVWGYCCHLFRIICAIAALSFLFHLLHSGH